MKKDFNEKLLLALMESTQFDQLLHFWYEETQCPVFILNQEFSMITHEGLQDVEQEVSWIADFLRIGHLPDSIVQTLGKEVISGSEPIISHFPGTDLTMIAGEVRYKTDKVLLGVFYHTEDSGQMWQAFQSLLDGASVIYAITEHHLDSKEIFIRDLVSGVITTEEQAESRAQQLSVFVRKDKPVCALVGRFIHPDNGTRKDICREIETAVFPGACALDMWNYIFILLLDHVQVMRGSESLKMAEAFFREKNMQICICPPAHRFLVAQGQYREAKEIMELLARKEVGDTIVFFEQYVFHYILDELLAQGGEEFFCVPEVLKMYEEDQRQGTENALTLYAFLICFRNYSEIADLLNISYNTAKKRASECEHIFGGQLFRFAPALFYSLKILCLKYPEFRIRCEEIGSQIRSIKR